MRSMCALGQILGSARSGNFWPSYLNCFSPCAPPRGPTMLCAQWETLDALLGGLAPRTAPAACWAAWADALPVPLQRLPAFAECCVDSLAGGGGCAPCLQNAAGARALLQAEGWQTCPEWWEVADGIRAPRLQDTGRGNWPHGWQSHATRTRNLHLRERVLLPTLSPSTFRARALASPTACRGMANSSPREACHTGGATCHADCPPPTAPPPFAD